VALKDVDQLAQTMGFANAEELHRLIGALPLNNQRDVALFKVWQESDGTKQTLLDLFPGLQDAGMVTTEAAATAAATPVDGETRQIMADEQKTIEQGHWDRDADN
jgi:hypothetical protein